MVERELILQVDSTSSLYAMVYNQTKITTLQGWEVARWLKVLALAEDPSLVSSIHLCRFRSTYNSSLGGSHTSAPALIHSHTGTHN